MLESDKTNKKTQADARHRYFSCKSSFAILTKNRSFMFSYEDESNSRKSHLLMLIQMARADGRFRLSEDRMLLEIAGRMGINEEELNTLKHEPSQFEIVLPKTEDERLIILYHLLFLMRLDRHISVKEEELCREMGFRLGLNPLMVEDMINTMVQYIDQKLPDHLLLETVKRYRN